MKNIFKFMSLLLLGALVFNSCSKDKGVYEDLQPQGSLVIIKDVQTGFYNLADTDNASIAFSVEGVGESINSIVINKSYNGGAAVQHATQSSLPGSLTVSLADALSGLGVAVGDLVVGDEITFTISDVSTASGTYGSGSSLTIPVSCPSELEGTFDVVTLGWCGETFTGEATWVHAGGGVYTCEDFTYGAYNVCYGAGAALPGGDVRLAELCNKIDYQGVDQWNETYEWHNLVIDGPNLTFEWSNTYAPEAGTTTLTRQDGKDWPPLTVN
ncbi:MAG: hypothetical protein ACI8VT_001541 [Saprospiraceae bacterium]|jgi:hypothetical protein